MKIISNKLVRILKIEYDNSPTNSHKARREMYEYLDKKYGKLSYRARRSGPHPDASKRDVGLAIIEVGGFTE